MEEDEAGAAGVVVGGPAEAFGFVGGAEVPVGLPPDGAVAVDGSLTGEGNVLSIAGVDEGGGPGHFDAGDAGGEHGVVGEVLGADEGDACGEIEGGVGLEEEGAGEVGSGLEGDRASGWGGCIEGLLDGGGVEGSSVALGSVAVGEKLFGSSERGVGEQNGGECKGCPGGAAGDVLGDVHDGSPPTGVYCAKSSKERL